MWLGRNQKGVRGIVRVDLEGREDSKWREENWEDAARRMGGVTREGEG